LRSRTDSIKGGHWKVELSMKHKSKVVRAPALLKHSQFEAEIMGRGYAWLDTGTRVADQGSYFQRKAAKASGFGGGVPGGDAFGRHFIGKEVLQPAKPLARNAYGQHLLNVLNDGMANSLAARV
jgi:dTDP-glucose pyrophosphorylase